ncbi:MAG: BamA/TamA family outer membrane protein [Longimicrobiales bacterium]
MSGLAFIGSEPFSSDTLRTLIATHPSHCSLLGIPLCLPFHLGQVIHRLDPEAVRQDVLKLMLFYRAEGYFGTRVVPTVEPDGPDHVRVTFAIQRGEPILLDALEVTGVEGIMNPDSLTRALPLQPGQLFDLGKFTASADMVLRGLYSRGHAYADILRNYSVDTVDNRAVASIQAIPGPRVIVDSIIVKGADHLGRANAIRQLTFRPGDVLQLTALAESQRNLYGLELVQIASVAVAPDSMQKPPPHDSTTATVAITVAEASVRQVDAAVGFGTVECLRTEASWLNRSFGGGARRLAVSGSVSKIGIGGRTQTGIGRSLCSAYNADTTFRSRVDYQFGVDFTQPYFLSPRNQIALNLAAERQSEPGIYQRESRGGRVSLNRRLGNRTFLTVAFDAERGSTHASPALYCAEFLVCQIGFTDSLARPRFRDEVELGFAHDRTDAPVDPSNGFNVATGFTWAPAALGSEVTFVRLSGQGGYYREIKPGWVAAFGARFGNLFRSATLDPTRNFLPPNERFFGGGANSVRGYDRNALGEGVYVTSAVDTSSAGVVIPADTVSTLFVPTGGTALAITSAELRFPSPFLSEFVRLALFVDAGAIGNGSILDLSPGNWRVTPGAGLRLSTPVGPVRFDVAYNAYGATAGPLLVSDEVSQQLVRVSDSYHPARGSVFSRFHITLGIGQAY